MTKSEAMTEYAIAQLGAPYVFGARGQLCTPSYRGGIKSSTQAAHPTIISKCQVLTGKAGTCSGCRYKGKRCYDCRGLTDCAAQAAGLRIDGNGCTSQWNNADNWAVQGEIGSMPLDKVCIVMRRRKSSSVMEHTALYMGDGSTIEASVDVKRKPLSAGKWTHYGILQGQFEGGITMPEDTAPDNKSSYATVRRGSSGESVQVLQQLLNKLGNTLKEDGAFGSLTDAALRVYQRLHGLEVDGVCGPITWASIIAEVAALDPLVQPDDGEADSDGDAATRYTLTTVALDAQTAAQLLFDHTSGTAVVTIRGLDAATATQLLDTFPGSTAVTER